jgi:hypothetical protein
VPGPQPREPDEDHPTSPAQTDDWDALHSTAVWLRVATSLGLCHVLLCGCCPVLVVGEPWVVICLVAHLLICTILIVVVGGLEQMSSRTSFLVVCSLTALATMLQLLFTVLVAWGLVDEIRYYGFSGDIAVRVVLALVWPVSLIVFLVAGIKAFAALRRSLLWHRRPRSRR